MKISVVCKFRWQQVPLSEEVVEEADQGAAQSRRVRYKVKDRLPVKVRRKGEAAPAAKKGTEKTVPKAIKRKIRVQDGITVGELAKRMGVKASDIIRKLIDLGIMATINQMLDSDTAMTLRKGRMMARLKSVKPM